MKRKKGERDRERKRERKKRKKEKRDLSIVPFPSKSSGDSPASLASIAAFALVKNRFISIQSVDQILGNRSLKSH